METKFFMVWSPAGTTPPRTRHATEEAAQRVAARLAGENPGVPFFVIETKGFAVTQQPVVWVSHSPAADLAGAAAPQIEAAN